MDKRAGDVDVFSSPGHACEYVEHYDLAPGDLIADENGISYTAGSQRQSVTLAPHGEVDWAHVRARVAATTSVTLTDESGSRLLDVLVSVYGLSA